MYQFYKNALKCQIIDNHTGHENFLTGMLISDFYTHREKKNNLFWSIGVLEYWSNDFRIEVFFSTLQYSITPGLKFSRTFGKLTITFIFVIVLNDFNIFCVVLL